MSTIRFPSECSMYHPADKSLRSRHILLHFILALIACLSANCSANAEVNYEDFQDGDLSDDSQLSWLFDGSFSVSDDGLMLSSPIGGVATGEAFDSDISDRAWSVRMQGRLLQSHGRFGVAIRNPLATKGIIGADGVVSALGYPGLSEGFAETDLRPSEEDIVVQIDYVNGFNEVIFLWAWRPGEQPERGTELLTIALTSPGEDPRLWLGSDEGAASAELRWIAFAENDRLPVHIPMSTLLLDCDYDSYTDEFGSFFEGSLEGGPTADEILNTDDIACSTEATIQHLLSEIGVRAGDANLDGLVNFADFLTLSSNFGQLGEWAQGDFDASGDIQFADFLILSANFGITPGLASVPEPSALTLLPPCLAILALRRR